MCKKNFFYSILEMIALYIFWYIHLINQWMIFIFFNNSSSWLDGGRWSQNILFYSILCRGEGTSWFRNTASECQLPSHFHPHCQLSTSLPPISIINNGKSSMKQQHDDGKKAHFIQYYTVDTTWTPLYSLHRYSNRIEENRVDL